MKSMLKIRVIPTLLWKQVGLVKGIGFDSWRRVGAVLPSIKVYNRREVDELVIFDITATMDKIEPDYESIMEFSKECFIPLTVGGGIKSLEHIRKLLQVGADKISINSEAYSNPNLIKEAASKYGSQSIVACIDAKKEIDGEFYCYSHCANIRTEKEVTSWAKELEKLGVGEIIISSIDKDGTMEGYDLELISKVANCVKIPVIASGGAGNYKHMHEAISHSNASAVAAASIFHFTELTPRGAKEYLGSKGIPVRKSRIIN